VTSKGFPRGFPHSGQTGRCTSIELIQLFVRDSDESELKEAIESVRNVDIARIFVDALLERNQEIAVLLLKRVITDIGKEEIKRYTERLEGRYALYICHFWVSEFINRSHVYYDGAVDVLRVMRGIADEREWKRYITTLMEQNAGKKKLLEKIRKTLLIQENQ